LRSFLEGENLESSGDRPGAESQPVVNAQ
jgi:hypothetical protein